MVMELAIAGATKKLSRSGVNAGTTIYGIGSFQVEVTYMHYAEAVRNLELHAYEKLNEEPVAGKRAMPEVL